MLFVQKMIGLMAEVSPAQLAELGSQLTKLDSRRDLVVLGTLSEDLRRLYTVLHLDGIEHYKEHTDWDKELKGIGDDSESSAARRKQISDQHDLAHAEYNFIRNAFVSSVIMEFPQIDREALVVTEGWQIAIVSRHRELDYFFSSFLAMAMGLNADDF